MHRTKEMRCAEFIEKWRRTERHSMFFPNYYEFRDACLKFFNDISKEYKHDEFVGLVTRAELKAMQDADRS